MKRCLPLMGLAALSCAGDKAPAPLRGGPAETAALPETPAPGPLPTTAPSGSGGAPPTVTPMPTSPAPAGAPDNVPDASATPDAGASEPPAEPTAPVPTVAPPPPPPPEPDAPLAALLITGGCYHDYAAQSETFRQLVTGETQFEWTVLREECTDSNSRQLELYEDPGWAQPYALVVHNECFADTSDPEYIRKITQAHRAGTPALVIHCAMHTYRAATVDDWREFLGVTTREHEAEREYPVTKIASDHPIVAGLPPDWVTPRDELYVIEKLWPSAEVLASTVSPVSGQEHPVVWVNDYHGTRVAGFTYGHSQATFNSPIFKDLLARALLWLVERDATD